MASRQERAQRTLAYINSKATFKKTPFWNPRVRKKDTDPWDEIRMICPPYLDSDELDPWLATQQYSLPVKGSDDPHTTGVPSFYDMPDPIKELVEEWSQSQDKKKRQKAKSITVKDSYICLIVDMNDPDEGIQIWRFGNMVMKQLLKYLNNEAWELWWDPVKGHNIQLSRTGKGLETKYELMLLPSSPLPNAEEILEQAATVDLARFIIVETPETLMEILDGDYDKDTARERRMARDDEFGPPVPYFVKRDSDAEVADKDTREKIKKKDSKTDEWGQEKEEDEETPPWEDEKGKKTEPGSVKDISDLPIEQQLEIARQTFVGAEVKFGYLNEEDQVEEGFGTVLEAMEDEDPPPGLMPGVILVVRSFQGEEFEVYPEKCTVQKPPTPETKRRRIGKPEVEAPKKDESSKGMMARLNSMRGKGGK